MAKQDNGIDIIVRMVREFRQWYLRRFGLPVQYSSQNAYTIEYNTMKGIYNMLTGTYRAKNPAVIPSDSAILEMWQHLLAYLEDKKNYYFTSLGSIHRSYNTIVAQMVRHIEKQRFSEQKAAGDAMQQKLDIVNSMMNGDRKRTCKG